MTVRSIQRHPYLDCSSASHILMPPVKTGMDELTARRVPKPLISRNECLRSQEMTDKAGETGMIEWQKP